MLLLGGLWWWSPADGNLDDVDYAIEGVPKEGEILDSGLLSLVESDHSTT